MSIVATLPGRDTAGVVADVLAPLVARGVIIRRPRVLGALERLDADRRAIARMREVAERHGPGPVLLGVPVRDVALVLSRQDARRVLAESPEPFAPASREKRAALGHFQPHGVLVSRGPEREERRRFNEEVLDTGRPHRFAERFASVVAQEAEVMLHNAIELGWDRFAHGWWRIVRRVVLGDGARDDHAVTDLLADLRRDANWAFARPRRDDRREAFERRLQAHVDRAEPGSVAALLGGDIGQVPQWLFAFDAAGHALLAALALIDGSRRDAAHLRAAVLEAVRLWPTTPAILRETTAETRWGTGTLPAGAGIVIFAPFFHRTGPHADAFAPEQWLEGPPPEDAALVPFSAGAVSCPGRDLVLLLTSALLRELLERGVRPQPLDEPLPATLSPFRLRFAVRA